MGDSEWWSEIMPCGHRRRHWSPLEGTIAGTLAFRADPESAGFCEICRAITAEREACALAAWGVYCRDAADYPVAITAAIRQRGR